VKTAGSRKLSPTSSGPPPGAFALLELALPRREAAIEQRRLVADRAQHPDEAGGDHPAGVVVGDHGVLVTDPERTHGGGEILRLGERVAAGEPRVGMAGQRGVEIDEDGAGEMAAGIGIAAGPGVDVPAAVGRHHLVAVLAEPVDVDKGIDHPEIIADGRSRR
jgi:hypothetical protein